MIQKMIATLIGIATLSGMGVSSVLYFQSRSDADAQHLDIAEYSERGRLENELKLVVLEIDYLLDMTSRDVREQNRLGYLNTVRVNLENRLRELQQGANQ